MRSKSSDNAFPHFDQALKPRPYRPFSEPFSRESELFILNTSTFKDITLVLHWKELTLAVQIPHPHSRRVQTPHQPRMNDGQMSMDCTGGGGGDVEASN